MSKLSQIEQKIKEVCPWLMELTFGTTIKHKSVPNKKGVYIGQSSHDKHHWMYQDNTTYPILLEHIEVLGREPQLSDLLYTVGASTAFKLDVVCEGRTTLYIRDRNLYPAVLGVKTAMDEWDKKTHGRRGAQYDLTKSVRENLENKELCDFIHQLICK